MKHDLVIFSKVITTSTTMQGAVTPDSSSLSSLPAEPLPVDWTQIKRRKRKRDDSSKEEESSSFCCEDPSCLDADTDADADDNARTDNFSRLNDDKFLTLKGKGIFCLHTLDCTWFQGQFVNSNKHKVKSLGILAVQRHLDECLKCGDGGYKEIDLTILSKKLSPDSAISQNASAGERKKVVIRKLSCTGGDMLRITPRKARANQKDGTENASFEAERIITGDKVESLVRRYFPNLVPSCNEDEGTFAEQLPDCAVVIGDMSITIRKEFLPKKKKQQEEETDDCWLD